MTPNLRNAKAAIRKTGSISSPGSVDTSFSVRIVWVIVISK
jgi:hypothetical protein